MVHVVFDHDVVGKLTEPYSSFDDLRRLLPAADIKVFGCCGTLVHSIESSAHLKAFLALTSEDGEKHIRTFENQKRNDDNWYRNVGLYRLSARTLEEDLDEADELQKLDNERIDLIRLESMLGPSDSATLCHGPWTAARKLPKWLLEKPPRKARLYDLKPFSIACLGGFSIRIHDAGCKTTLYLCKEEGASDLHEMLVTVQALGRQSKPIRWAPVKRRSLHFEVSSDGYEDDEDHKAKFALTVHHYWGN
eukprot:GEMP01055826.1.p1 GENE.GEMP01055826.1~~GEMP01055826.1.p1  ORF type:complete len:249 (+),score=42.95 GEMP01055826.1:27-773(+)